MRTGCGKRKVRTKALTIKHDCTFSNRNFDHRRDGRALFCGLCTARGLAGAGAGAGAGGTAIVSHSSESGGGRSKIAPRIPRDSLPDRTGCGKAVRPPTSVSRVSGCPCFACACGSVASRVYVPREGEVPLMDKVWSAFVIELRIKHRQAHAATTREITLRGQW